MDVLKLHQDSLIRKGFSDIDSEMCIFVKMYQGLMLIEGRTNISITEKGDFFMGFGDPRFKEFLKKNNFKQSVFSEIDGKYYENSLHDDNYINGALDDEEGISVTYN